MYVYMYIIFISTTRHLFEISDIFYLIYRRFRKSLYSLYMICVYI